MTKTWRRIAAQTAALVALGIIVLDALAIGVVLDIEHHDAAQRLDQATIDPDALTYPPVDTVIYQQGPNGLRTSPGAPSGPLDPAGMVDPPSRDRLVHRGDHEYLVRTFRQNDLTIQVAVDLTHQEEERDRLLVGLAAAGGAGVFVAGGLGALVARRAIEPLGQAIARQRRFVADASHELRTPLTQLHLRAQLLEGSGDLPARSHDDAVALVRSSRQMGEILDELLAAAQLDAQPQEQPEVDLWALAEEVTTAEQVRATARNISLLLQPAEPVRLVVRGAPTALRRVMASLVDNALAHTPDGGQVEVQLEAGLRVARIRVRDNGSGFDEAQVSQLFERFRRGTHDDPRRFGLGLALAHEVVTAHGGTIEATGAPGRGACFTVTLPT